MNNSPWPIVALDEVLSLSIDAVTVDPLQVYRIAGVYSFARGLLKREPLLGSNTTYKVFHRLHKDDFVISQPKAWEGALARITSEFEGWFLSPVFPTFHAISDRLDIRYLEWYCRQAKVWNQLKNKARGIGARRESVLPKQFLSLQIPLPPLAEQRRIVARIEALAARVEAARELRTKAQEEVNRVMESNLGDIFENLSQEFGTLEIQKFAGVKGGKRLPRGERLIGTPTPFVYIRVSDMENFSVNMVNLMYVPDHIHPAIAQYTISSQNVYVTIAGTIGQPGLLPDALDGANLTENAAKLVFDNMKYDKRFVTYALRSPQVQEQFRQRQTKSAQPKLALRTIRTTRVAIPPLPEQHRIVARLDALQAKITAVQQHQAATQARLEALLPSILDRAFKGEL